MNSRANHSTRDAINIWTLELLLGYERFSNEAKLAYI
jgi:hypothetical protein